MHHTDLSEMNLITIISQKLIYYILNNLNRRLVCIEHGFDFSFQFAYKKTSPNKNHAGGNASILKLKKKTPL